MCTYERLGLFLFIAFIAVIYVPAFFVLLRRLTGGSKSISPVGKAVLLVAGLGSLAMAYGALVEPYWVEVTHVSVSSSKLSNYGRPIRVVQISDLHCEPADRVVPRLPELIRGQRPDVIVFTGDSINSRAAAAVFRHCFAELSTIAPTFAVLGNHDIRCWSDVNLFRGTGVTALNGVSCRLTIGGQPVYLAGVAFDSEALMDQALNAVPQNAFKLFLYHSPDLVMELARRHVDLICAGHTHGGQVCLPLYGAIVTQSKFGKRFESGLHRVDDSLLYVNRGIGMEGGFDPRVRFLARPEITVFDLTPASRKPGLAAADSLKRKKT